MQLKNNGLVTWPQKGAKITLPRGPGLASSHIGFDRNLSLMRCCFTSVFFCSVWGTWSGKFMWWTCFGKNLLHSSRVGESTWLGVCCGLRSRCRKGQGIGRKGKREGDWGEREETALPSFYPLALFSLPFLCLPRRLCTLNVWNEWIVFDAIFPCSVFWVLNSVSADCRITNGGHQKLFNFYF